MVGATTGFITIAPPSIPATDPFRTQSFRISDIERISKAMPFSDALLKTGQLRYANLQGSNGFSSAMPNRIERNTAGFGFLELMFALTIALRSEEHTPDLQSHSFIPY